jgi:hypothetical protein
VAGGGNASPFGQIMPRAGSGSARLVVTHRGREWRLAGRCVTPSALATNVDRLGYAAFRFRAAPAWLAFGCGCGRVRGAGRRSNGPGRRWSRTRSGPAGRPGPDRWTPSRSVAAGTRYRPRAAPAAAAPARSAPAGPGPLIPGRLAQAPVGERLAQLLRPGPGRRDGPRAHNLSPQDGTWVSVASPRAALSSRRMRVIASSAAASWPRLARRWACSSWSSR